MSNSLSTLLSFQPVILSAEEGGMPQVPPSGTFALAWDFVCICDDLETEQLLSLSTMFLILFVFRHWAQL